MSETLGQPTWVEFRTYSDAAETTLDDPTELTITLRLPDVSEDPHTWPTGDVERTAEGIFRVLAPNDVAGFWSAHAEATGAVTTAEDYGWEVRPAFGVQPWQPDLVTVATYISERTVTVTAPGVEEPVGTFTADTTPTAEQALVLIDQATRHVTMKNGTVAAAYYPQARDAAAMRAAGLIELAYPVRQADINTGRDWLRLADEAIKDLVTANSNPGATNPSALIPVYSFPDPPVYGDIPL